MADRDWPLVETLLDECGNDPRATLEALVRALPSKDVLDTLEWVSSVEDWAYKVHEKGFIFDSETNKVFWQPRSY